MNEKRDWLEKLIDLLRLMIKILKEEKRPTAQLDKLLEELENLLKNNDEGKIAFVFGKFEEIFFRLVNNQPSKDATIKNNKDKSEKDKQKPTKLGNNNGKKGGKGQKRSR